MTVWAIKLIAVGLMLVDHAGMFLFPSWLWVRLVGRGAMPLFGWLVANGLKKTRNVERYFLRLWLLAVAAQGPFIVAVRLIDEKFFKVNVVGEYAMAVGVVYLLENGERWKGLGLALIAGVTMWTIGDFRGWGMVSVWLSYFLFTRPKVNTAVQWMVLAAGCYVPIWYRYMTAEVGTIVEFEWWEVMLPWGAMGLMLTWFYNEKLGPKVKWWFYGVYIVQYVVFYLLLVMR